MNKRPDQTEASPCYFKYIDQVPDGDISDGERLFVFRAYWFARGSSTS